MFHRGQKVIITESSVIGRMHPAIGDIGYIENMFLFPEDRFILASIVMCSYKKGGPRAEHKKFIINIGMNDTIKSKIEAGVNKLFFLSKESVNLLPAFIFKNRVGHSAKYERMVSFPQIVGTCGAWTGYTSKKKNKNKKCDTRVVIPYGHIKELRDKCTLHNMPTLEIKAWLRALLPNIVAISSFYKVINRDEVGGDLVDKVNRILSSFGSLFEAIERKDLSYIKVRMKVLNEIKSSVRQLVIDPLMKLNVMSMMAMTRLYKLYINAYGHKDAVMGTQRLLSDKPVYTLLDTDMAMNNGIKPLYSKLICEYIYKSILIDRNTKYALQSISDCIPKSWSINDIATIADEAKSDYNSGSAALNRIFDVMGGSKEPESAYSAYDLPYDLGDLYKVVNPDTRAKIDKILNFATQEVVKHDEPERRKRQIEWGQIDFDNIEVDDL